MCGALKETMRLKWTKTVSKVLICFVIGFMTMVFSRDVFSAVTHSSNPVALNQKVIKMLEKGRVIVKSEVNSFVDKKTKVKMQRLDFSVLGMQTNRCSRSLRKLTLYENYKDYLEFVLQSRYYEKTARAEFVIKPPFIKNLFVLKINIPRIRKEGSYPYILVKGIFPNLKGTIHVIKYKNKCIFYNLASGQGKYTGYWDTILETITSTLGKAGMERLLRISKF